MTERRSPYEQMRALGASDGVIAAYDILADDGMTPEQAAEMSVAAERQGKDPVAFARHIVKLRKGAPMTGQTDATEVEALADALRFGVTVGSVEEGRAFRESVARRLLTSDWLAAERAAAEARGAERALREAADLGPLHYAATHTGRDARGRDVVEAAWLRARAAAARGGA